MRLSRGGGCPVAIGAPVESYAPVASGQVEVAVGIGANPLVAASVGESAVLRDVEGVGAAGGVVDCGVDEPLGVDVALCNEPVVTFVGGFEVAQVWKVRYGRFGCCANGDVGSVAGVALRADGTYKEVVLVVALQPLDGDCCVAGGQSGAAPRSGNEHNVVVFYCKLIDIVRVAPAEGDRRGVYLCGHQSLGRGTHIEGEIEAVVAVGVGPIAGSNVGGVAVGVVGDHVERVDDEDIRRVDAKSLHSLWSGHPYRGLRGIDYLYVAVFVKLDLVAEKCSTRRGVVGLECEFDNEHPVGS